MNHIDPNNPFADIDEHEFEKELARDIKAPVSEHTESIGDVEIPGFVEDCPKCRGTGSWALTHGHGRTGYYNDGRCSKCDGKGKLNFKTSPEARAKARKYSQKRQVVKAQEAVAALPEDVRTWIAAGMTAGNDFAFSLNTAVAKYGHLTEGQTAAVRKAIARDQDKAAGFETWVKQFDQDVLGWLTTETENGNEFAGSLLDAGRKWGSLTENQLAAVLKNIAEPKGEKPTSDLDLADLPKGYYAVPDGNSRLKIAVRRPGKNSKWYGWTFVDDGAAYGSRRTYGKQAPDGLYIGYLGDKLQAILEDPHAASIAYGKLTGSCGVCGRILEDEKSVAAGIGPVCAAKF